MSAPYLRVTYLFATPDGKYVLTYLDREGRSEENALFHLRDVVFCSPEVCLIPITIKEIYWRKDPDKHPIRGDIQWYAIAINAIGKSFFLDVPAMRVLWG